jgi:hypothetical protein
LAVEKKTASKVLFCSLAFSQESPLALCIISLASLLTQMNESARKKPRLSAKDPKQDPVPEAWLPQHLVEASGEIFEAGITSATRSSYATHVTGVNGYQKILLGLGAPSIAALWPARPLAIQVWLHYLVNVANVRHPEKYLAGLRDAHIRLRLDWLLTDSAKQYVARLRAGAAIMAHDINLADELRNPPKAELVFAITPLILRLFCLHAPFHQCPNGRLFLACTAWAVYACHRGGELFSTASSGKARNKRITHAQFKKDPKHLREMGATVVLNFDKTHSSQQISCWLPALGSDPTCPITLLENAHTDLPGPISPQRLLFQTVDDHPVSFRVMRQWTETALLAIGVVMPPLFYISLKSWRQGHTLAAERLPSLDKLTENMRTCGRWAGASWRRYTPRSQGIALQVIGLAAQSTEDHQSCSGPGELSSEGAVPNFRHSRKSPFLLPEEKEQSGSSSLTEALEAEKLQKQAGVRSDQDDNVDQLAEPEVLAEDSDEDLAQSRALAAVAQSISVGNNNDERRAQHKRTRKPVLRLDAGLGW